MSLDANPTACAHLGKNTPQKLVNCVTKDDLWAHMVGHMAHDTQVFISTKIGGGHMKRLTRPQVAVPYGTVTR